MVFVILRSVVKSVHLIILLHVIRDRKGSAAKRHEDLEDLESFYYYFFPAAHLK